MTGRSEIRTMLLKNGIPPSDATMIEDVANHAVAEAVDAMIRVCNALPEPTCYKVMGISAVLLSHHLQNAVENYLTEKIRDAQKFD